MFDVEYVSPDVFSCCILTELLPQWIKQRLCVTPSTAAGEGCSGSSCFVEQEKQPLKLIKEKQQVGKGLRDQLVSYTLCFPKHFPPNLTHHQIKKC